MSSLPCLLFGTTFLSVSWGAVGAQKERAICLAKQIGSKLGFSTRRQKQATCLSQTDRCHSSLCVPSVKLASESGQKLPQPSTLTSHTAPKHCKYQIRQSSIQFWSISLKWSQEFMLFSTFSTRNRIMPLGFLQGLFFKLSVPPTSLTTVRTEPAARGSATARGAGRAPRSQALKALEILGSESSVADTAQRNGSEVQLPSGQASGSPFT